MNTIGTILLVGGVISLALLVAWIRTRQHVYGLFIALVVFIVIAICLGLPVYLILIGSALIILGVILWMFDLLLVIAIVFALIPLLALGIFAVNPALLNSVKAGGEGIDSIAFNPETDVLPDDAKCATNLFVDYSVRTVETGNPEKKQFATAISIPLKGTGDAAVMKEMLAESCGNPTVLLETVDDMLLWNDSEIPGAEANKGWLNEIRATVNSAPTGINSFMESRSDENAALTVSPLFQKYAAWVNTVLLRSNADGKQQLTSVRNWELSAAWAPNTGLPVAQQATVQESKPAWVRVFKDKVGTCLLRFGWNLEDRRLEIFPCAQPTPPAATPPSETPGTPGTPGTPETPGTPGTSTCEERGDCPPVTCVICAKDPGVSKTPVDGADVQPNDTFKPPPLAATDPAAATPGGDTSTGGTDTPITGADPSAGNPPAGDVGTGDPGDGSSGSVNPPGTSATPDPGNSGDSGSPYGG